MKKVTKIAGALLALCVMGSAFASGKKDGQGEIKIGVLSFLNLSEEDYAAVSRARKNVEIEMEKEGSVKLNPHHKQDELFVPRIVFYDTLDAMLMALESGEIFSMSGIPSTTANYLCNRNDRLEVSLEFTRYMPDIWKEDSFSAKTIATLSDGFSFMMLEKNVALRDDFNKAIKAMKADGTISKLIRAHIFEVMRGKDISPIIPEFEAGRKTIKVAVTGSLPPMDYVAADGSFAGFNTAMLAEIGERLDRNITMVQVSSVGRATALASGTVDVVFWTRGLSEPVVEKLGDNSAELKTKTDAGLSDASAELRKSLEAYNDTMDVDKSRKKDMPENTVITIPYFTDMPVGVTLRK